MKAVKATYESGRVTLRESMPEVEDGAVDVLVIFPEEQDDPWTAILADDRPRPALEAMVRQIEEEMAAGKTEPLDLNRL